MPSRPVRKPSKKRSSVTDAMVSNPEKIISGVDRQLIELIDSEEDAAKLAAVWPGAPTPCVVVVSGSKGHFNYIKNIHERLAIEGFVLALPYPYRPKLPGQLPLRQEAAMKRRQAKEDAALTKEQRERVESNRLRAIAKLAKRVPV